jgi:hypothetical protein
VAMMVKKAIHNTYPKQLQKNASLQRKVSHKKGTFIMSSYVTFEEVERLIEYIPIEYDNPYQNDSAKFAKIPYLSLTKEFFNVNALAHDFLLKRKVRM